MRIPGIAADHRTVMNININGAVLWDMDGTLVDSAEYHWQAWRDTMARAGFSITHEQFLATFGQRNDSILRQWLGEKATPAVIQRIGDAKEELYRQIVRDRGLAALPGALDWVQLLQTGGWRQAIASAAPRANIETILDVLEAAECFQAIVSAEDVHRGKPDPEVFLIAASKLGGLHRALHRCRRRGTRYRSRARGRNEKHRRESERQAIVGGHCGELSRPSG